VAAEIPPQTPEREEASQVSETKLGASAVRPRVGAAIAIGVIIAVVVWLLLRGGGGHTTKHIALARSHQAAMTPAQLQALPGQVGHPVYWAGQRHGHVYAVTWAAKGDVFVRYLKPGTPIDTPSHKFLVVATYPVPDAYAKAQKGSHIKGALVLHLANGGLGVSQAKIPHSVYVAYPGVPVLIEVYSPSPAFARRLVTAGKITPVG
jgi:hypothetical protein